MGDDWKIVTLEHRWRVESLFFSNKGPLVIIRDPEGKEVARMALDTLARTAIFQTDFKLR